MLTIKAYKNGGVTEYEVLDSMIEPNDREYFRGSDIMLSMEDLRMGTAIYALFPNMNDEEELLTLDFNNNPKVAFHKLRISCENWENRRRK